MIDFINVITRGFLVIVIGVIAFISRLSVSPVLEYDESRGKPEIVDRLILRDPTENEFILTICLMIAVGTSTEKIIIKFITAVIAKQLNVDLQGDSMGYQTTRDQLPSRDERRVDDDVDERDALVDPDEGP